MDDVSALRPAEGAVEQHLQSRTETGLSAPSTAPHRFLPQASSNSSCSVASSLDLQSPLLSPEVIKALLAQVLFLCQGPAGDGTIRVEPTRGRLPQQLPITSSDRRPLVRQTELEPLTASGPITGKRARDDDASVEVPAPPLKQRPVLGPSASCTDQIAFGYLDELCQWHTGTRPSDVQDRYRLDL
ncbi:MAG: hypothetical protein ACOYKZ_05295 [Chlamydiia bacterium]